MLSYNTDKDELTVLVGDLHFPNGVQVRRGKVLVAEMGKARILKLVSPQACTIILLEDNKMGGSRFSPSAEELSVFIDNLPGYPDNIRHGSDGTLWVPIPTTRSETDNWLGARPTIRSMLTKVRAQVFSLCPPC